MYKSKLSPEQALETIKLRMKYDSSKTLTENVGIVKEQKSDEEFNEDVIGSYERKELKKIAQDNVNSGVKTPSGYDLSATKPAVETKPAKETTTTTTTKTEVVLPSELKDVKAFQDWLDANKKGWAAGYTDGIVNKGRGYGTFGPRTKKAWDTYKDEFLKTPTTTPTPAKSEEEEAESVYGDNPSDIIASN